MTETLFIADLHLEPELPQLAAWFLDLLATRARAADALYIVGDLFEVWIGDDDPTPFVAQIQDAIRALVEHGVPVFVQHGNRDFLLGPAFAARTGATLLADRVVIDLYGTPVLLMHGDQLCTDDVEYQRFRAQVRDPAWQAELLAKSVEERQSIARHARTLSAASQAERAAMAAIDDVNEAAVAAAMREAGVRHLIHGHTHRPAIHHHDNGERVVIPDWRNDAGGLLSWTRAAHTLESWPSA